MAGNPLPSFAPLLDGVAPAPMVPRRYRVESMRSETVDTVTFAVEPVDDPSPPFRPGQFNMLYIFGVGEVPISISGETASGAMVHTVRSVGAVTDALCRAGEGTVIGLRGPYGTDWGLDGAAGRDVVVVGGGIGLAPLRPAIRHLLGNREHFGAVSIFLGARSPGDLIYRDEIESWRRLPGVTVEVTVDHADSTKVGSTRADSTLADSTLADDTWHGHVGVVTELIPPHLDPDSLALVCGPEVMIRFAARTLIDGGVRPDQMMVSMERNMKCAIGACGHCQFGPEFVCYGGPVFPYTRVARLMSIREV